MVRLVQNSFFGGQLDYEMMARQDYGLYSKGATKLENFIIGKKGALTKRNGFDALCNITSLFGISPSSYVRLIPFAYTKDTGFVLLMSFAKWYMICTMPGNIFSYYQVAGSAVKEYSEEDIKDLDYQQCGDVMFIAHPRHPPARIVHNADNTFVLEQIDFTQKFNGIPEITGAVVDRKSVNSKGASTYVEEYRVSAIFGDEETFTCEAYRNEYAPNKASHWDGTAYLMPWTDSQSITLTIKPSLRGSVPPDKICVYKKAANYFGLIGTVDITDKEQNLPVEWMNSRDPDLVSDTDDEEAEYDINSTDSVNGSKIATYGWLIDPKFGFTFNTSWAFTGATVSVGIGMIHCKISATDDGGKKAVMTFPGYNPCTLTVTVGTEVKAVAVAGAESKSETVEMLEGESSEDFIVRVKAKITDFATSLAYVNKVDFEFGASSDTTMLLESSAFIDIHGISISAVKDISTVTFVDNYITPSTEVTPFDDDAFGDVFSSNGEYPSSVAVSQQRLIWASTDNDPSRVLASAIGDFYTYYPHEVQVPNDAIDFKLPITRFPKIHHICELKSLLMFNSACEWLVSSASSVSGLTYETIQAVPQTYSGSAQRLKPLVATNSVLFCERTKQSVRQFRYDISEDGFTGTDVSVLSSSIFAYTPIIDWTYQQFPLGTVWCVLSDGTLAAFEYMPEQDIKAWMTHTLGGGGKVKAIGTTYAISPFLDEVSANADYDFADTEEVMIVTERHGELWLERMRPQRKVGEDTIYHSLCLDWLHVFAPSTDGPEDDTEKILRTIGDNGGFITADDTDGSFTPGDGITCEKAIELLSDESFGGLVYAGYKFTARYISVYPVLGNNIIGNGQFDIKNIIGIGLRLQSSIGGRIRAYGTDDFEDIPYGYNDPQREHGIQVYKSDDGIWHIMLSNHDTNIMLLPGANTRDGRIELIQDMEYPITVMSYELDFETENGGRQK